MNDVGDWASLISAIAALFGLGFVGIQVADQVKATEANSATLILSELRARWADYLRSTTTGAPEQEIVFAFSEVMNYYEALCFLINNKIISRRVSGLVAPAIVRAMQRLANDEALRARVKRLAKGEALSALRNFVDERKADLENIAAVSEMLQSNA